jgi:diguanylate cyclase (GGDEF)-like protein
MTGQRATASGRGKQERPFAETGAASLGSSTDSAVTNRNTLGEAWETCDRRCHEQEYVGRSLGNLRQTVKEFAKCLTVAVSEDRESDTRIEDQLSRLVTAIGSADTETIRREALGIATLVRGAIARRRDREAEQLVHLGKQVRLLRQELDVARTKATLDPLTQLYNRTAFDEEIDKVARLGLLLGSEPCLVMVDVDHFKLINDQHGHPVGDAVLRAVADNLVRHFLRKEDFVTRYGGEEFAIVVRDSTLEKVAQRTDRARQVLAQMAIDAQDSTVRVTQSAGVAALVAGEPVSQWIRRADRALYAAKNGGRNRVELASPEPVDVSLGPRASLRSQ